MPDLTLRDLVDAARDAVAADPWVWRWVAFGALALVALAFVVGVALGWTGVLA